MDPINKIRSLFGSSKATKNAQSQVIKDEVALILGTKSNTTNPAKAKLDAVTAGLLEAQKLMKSGQNSDKLKLLCQELEKLGPSAIHEALKKLNELRTEYSRLKLKRGGQEVNELVYDKLVPLQESYTMLYKVFSEIRSEARENHDQSYKDAHDSLSRAMLQPSLDPKASVHQESYDPGLRSMAKTVFTNAYARNKLKEGIGLWANGLLSATQAAISKHVFRDITKDPSAVMNEAKTLMGNCFAALGQVFSYTVFGRELITASRNVVKRTDVESREDLALANALQVKMQTRVEKFAAGNEVSADDVKKLTIKEAHIHDGVCAGFSLELSLQALNSEGGDFRQIVAKHAKGAPPAAHAHQAVYESLGRDTMSLEDLVAAMRNQQMYALNPEKGEGIYKADFNNVNSCYLSFSRKGGCNDSPLGRAVDAVKKAQGDNIGATKNGQSYIKDTVKFKEAVLKELRSDERSSLDAFNIAKNELEWLMGNLEVRFMFQYCQDNLPEPFRSSGGVECEKVKADLNVASLLSVVSNQEISKNLNYMINKENNVSRYLAVANARGAKFVRTEKWLGCGFAAKNDDEILDKMDRLPNGCYVFSIALQGSGHAMQFYKEDGKQYLFDPNLGLIDCSPPRLKEQISKLLELLYPGVDVQGSISEGKSHSINLVQVVKDPDATDLLAEDIAKLAADSGRLRRN